MTSLREGAPWFWNIKEWRGALDGPPRRTLLSTPATVSQALKLAARKSPGWDALTDEEREALDTVAHYAGVILTGCEGRGTYWRQIADMAKVIAGRV